MKIICSHCGKLTEVRGLGRKRLAMLVKNICDALRDSSTATQAAKEVRLQPGLHLQNLESQ